MIERDQSLESSVASHKQSLQSLALKLFDALTEVHGLPAKTRHVLQLAAAFYERASESPTESAHRLGRDLALAAPISDRTADEQALIASVVALQRDKVRPEQEPAFLRLGEKDQHTALLLAALLQIAAAIAGSSDSDLRAISVADGEVCLAISGPDPGEAVDKARRKFWRETLGDIVFRAAAPEDADASELPAGIAKNGHQHALVEVSIPLAPEHDLRLLNGGEPIAEGARRVLLRFFDKLLAREGGIRRDDDPEDVHQMRVATRRLRAALQVVEGIYDPAQIRRFRRGLRRVAQALGNVRDLDVFAVHVMAYRDSLPAEEHLAIAPLLAALETRRSQARDILLDDLDERRYEKFKRAFASFLTTPGAGLAGASGVDARMRVRDVAGSAILRRYEQWRAHEMALAHPTDKSLHAARIAGKRLRYTLEFFADALGPQVEQVLDPLAALQENLGKLQDAVVARGYVDALGLSDDKGAQTYLAARDAEHDSHLAALPQLWDQVGRAAYQRQLFKLIVKL